MRAPLIITVLAAAAFALTACEPPIVDSPPGTPWTSTTLTINGNDRYTAAGDPTFLAVTAPLSNTDSNTRTSLTHSAAPTSVDQAICATITGATAPSAQEGLVLRDDGTHAVTVTKNIWSAAYWTINVHVWNTDLPTDNGRFVLAGSWPLPGLGYPATPAPLPWRMCATATGSTVSFKTWPLTRQEPPAGDPCCTGSLPLTVWAGRPGVYVGHLPAGHTVAYTNIGWS